MRFLVTVLAIVALSGATFSVREIDGNVVTTTVNGRNIHITDTIWKSNINVKDNFGTLKNGVRTIIGNPGGYIYAADALVKRGNQTGEHVRLICTNGCISAATQFLGAKHVCMGRNGWFGFHAATKSAWGFWKDPEATLTMAQSYPPAIRKMFLSKWQTRWGWGLFRVTSAQLKQIDPNLEYCK